MRPFLMLFFAVLVSTQLVSCAHQGVGKFFKRTGAAIESFGDKIIKKAEKPETKDNVNEPVPALEANAQPEPTAEPIADLNGEAGMMISSELVAKAQDRLNQLGYNSGPVDGILGRKTSKAVKAFERDNNMPVEGMVTAKLVDALQVSNNFAPKNQNWPQQNNLHKIKTISSNVQPEKASISGLWTGFFYCSERKFALELTIKDTPKTNHLSADFVFSSFGFGVPAPSGRVAMSGMHKTYGNLHFIKLRGSEWVEQPGAPIQEYNFNGNFDHNYSVLTGKITDCGEVQLSRRPAENMRRLAGVRFSH